MFNLRKFERSASSKFDNEIMRELRSVSFHYRNKQRKDAAFWAAFDWLFAQPVFKDYSDNDIFAVDRTAKVLCYLEGILSQIEPENPRLDAFSGCGKGSRSASDGSAWSKSIREAGEENVQFDAERCLFAVKTSDGCDRIVPVELVATGVIPVQKMKKAVRFMVEEEIRGKVYRKEAAVDREVEDILLAYGKFLQGLKKFA